MGLESLKTPLYLCTLPITMEGIMLKGRTCLYIMLYYFKTLHACNHIESPVCNDHVHKALHTKLGHFNLNLLKGKANVTLLESINLQKAILCSVACKCPSQELIGQQVLDQCKVKHAGNISRNISRKHPIRVMCFKRKQKSRLKLYLKAAKRHKKIC